MFSPSLKIFFALVCICLDENGSGNFRFFFLVLRLVVCKLCMGRPKNGRQEVHTAHGTETVRSWLIGAVRDKYAAKNIARNKIRKLCRQITSFFHYDGVYLACTHPAVRTTIAICSIEMSIYPCRTSLDGVWLMCCARRLVLRVQDHFNVIALFMTRKHLYLAIIVATISQVSDKLRALLRPFSHTLLEVRAVF